MGRGLFHKLAPHGGSSAQRMFAQPGFENNTRLIFAGAIDAMHQSMANSFPSSLQPAFQAAISLSRHMAGD